MLASENNPKKIGILRFGFIDIRKEDKSHENLEHISCLIEINNKIVDILRSGDDLCYLHFQEDDNLLIDFKSKQIIDLNCVKIQVNSSLFKSFGDNFMKWFPLIIHQNNQKIDSGVRALLEFHIERIDTSQPTEASLLKRDIPESAKSTKPSSQGDEAKEMKRDVDEMRKRAAVLAERLAERKPHLKHKITILKNECESLYRNIAEMENKGMTKYLYDELLAKKNILNNIFKKIDAEDPERRENEVENKQISSALHPVKESLSDYLPQAHSATVSPSRVLAERNIPRFTNSMSENVFNNKPSSTSVSPNRVLVERNMPKTASAANAANENVSNSKADKNGDSLQRFSGKSARHSPHAENKFKANSGGSKKESSPPGKKQKGDELTKVFKDLDQEIGKLAQYSLRMEGENQVITSYNKLLEQYRENLHVLEAEKEELRKRLEETTEDNNYLLRLFQSILTAVQRSQLSARDSISNDINEICSFIKRAFEKIDGRLNSEKSAEDQKLARTVDEALREIAEIFLLTEQRAQKFYDEVNQMLLASAGKLQSGMRGNEIENINSAAKTQLFHHPRDNTSTRAEKPNERAGDLPLENNQKISIHHNNCCLKKTSNSPKRATLLAEDSSMEQSASVLDIDGALDVFRSANFLEKDIIKQKDGSYKYNGKKINLQLMNGVLSVRVGGGYMQLGEYLRLLKYQEHAISLAADRLRSYSPTERSQETIGERSQMNLDDVETLRRNEKPGSLSAYGRGGLSSGYFEHF